MIHPSTELKFINDTIGYGVFATAFIPEGTITYVRDSLEIHISPSDYKKHEPEVQEIIDKYSYVDEKGYKIVSWDIGKYVNHCCNFNTISTGYGFEIAVRDIQPGEEITDEYGIFNIESEMYLCCSYKNCRKVIKDNDLETFYPKWDKTIKKALSKSNNVDQPLIKFLDKKILKQYQEFLTDNRKYKSVYSLKYHRVGIPINNTPAI